MAERPFKCPAFLAESLPFSNPALVTPRPGRGKTKEKRRKTGAGAAPRGLESPPMQTPVNDIEARLVSEVFLHDPYLLLRQMRAKAPVYWSEAIGGWLLTRYDDIVVTFKDTARFSNERRLGQAVAYLPPEKRANY